MSSIRKEKKVTLSRDTLELHAEFYDNANDVVNDCRTRPLRHSDYNVGTSFRKSWEGVDSYDEALTLLKDGYQSAVESFRGELKATSTNYTPRFKFSNDVYGFAPIVPLAINGIPTCMNNMTLRPIKAKVLDVYYDIGVIAKYTPEDIIKAGKSVLGTIIELERIGYRFNLYAVQSYYGPSQKAIDFLCVKVKSSNTPIDLKRMSFPLVHPAFFRVIGFDWQGKSPITRYVGGGRGKDFATQRGSDEVKAIVNEMFGNTACYISAAKVIDDGFNREKLKEVFTDVRPKK